MKTMKTSVLTVVIGASAIAALGLTSNPASADITYFSSPPKPSLDKPTGKWFITSSDDGIEFYALTPFTSTRTTDRNLYVNSAVMVKDSQYVGTKFLQIDCGNLRYREVMPGLAMDRRDDQPSSVTPQSYSWQRFKQGTALLNVGKTLCEKAAGDRGLEWTWARY
jgi:hypothetical protein